MHQHTEYVMSAAHISDVAHGGKQDTKCCKVLGCTSQLLNKYCQKKRVCEQHIKAAAVQCEGQGDTLFRDLKSCSRLQLHLPASSCKFLQAAAALGCARIVAD
ncbi:hypothetical protein OEZ86_003391 [Tetradesmus obliquus]|nr:hypothetical protein OEZ86_003391 [Tetradesmus obliquus]